MTRILTYPFCRASLLLAVLLLGVGLAAAQQASPEMAGVLEATKATSSGPSKLLLVVLAYMAMWLGLGGYVYFLHQRLTTVRKELAWLAEHLDQHPPRE